MTIKSSQTLVSEALKEIKTISPEEALELSNENKCNLIDLRDIRELENEGRIEKSLHIPRGMLEFWLDPESVYFKDDKYGNIIRYYHLMSTPLVPGFNKGKCKNPKFAFQVNFESQTSTIHAQNCGGFKYTKVKKGEVIGKMGKAGDVHFSLGIGGRKIDDGTDAAPKFFLIAPEDRFEWENLPTDSDAYLFPVMSKKYLEEIGYYK